MRICFYNVTATYLKGGLETYCWEAGRAMARRGHDVTIVAGDRGGARHPEVRLVQFPFRAEKEWPDLGVRFRRLAERLSFASNAAAHLLDAQYEAIVINKPFDFPVLWRMRRAGLRATTVFRSGGTDFFPGDRLFAGAVDRWASSSTYNARQVGRRYHRDVLTIHNGVDTDAFARGAQDGNLRAQLEISGDDLLLVSVGRLVGWKGHDTIIRALCELPANVHFLVVGEGPERPVLEALAKSSKVDRRVHFSGPVRHEELPSLLSACDVLVQPSTGEEAFGISVVEGMACGLAVLASDNGGLPEIVVDGTTGRLLPPGDASAWRTAIAALLADRQILRRWAEAGRARAVEQFTWAANATRLEALITGRPG